MQKKKCSKCKKILPIDNFSPCSGGKYLRPECRECNYILSKKRKLLREKYGQPDDNFKCPICLRSKDELNGTGGASKSIWVVDHNHETDEFRGYLCHSCNRGLGIFNDDVSLFTRAVLYLSKNETSK